VIYLDCSYIYRETANTGIQRVTRSITREAMGLRNDICPAVLHDDVFYKLTDIPKQDDAPFSHKGEPIHFKAGDIYFVLDSSWIYSIPEKLSHLKTYGVKTGVMYYDLIPITHAKMCSVSKDLFSEWVLETAKYSDFFACISNATKESLKRESAKLYPSREINDDITFSFRLGADISAYDANYSPYDDTLLRVFNDNHTYLTVSTVEPRKNHAMLLDAFDLLWKNFPTTKLCFIGKEGWMIEEVVKRIRTHQKLNSNLFWLESVNDKDVQWAYRKAKCVLFPSFEEGFGLPIIEALNCGTPVVASDIPVFHEVAGDRIGYLDPHDPMSLVKWIERIERKGIPKEIVPDGSFKWATWKDSTVELLEKMELADNCVRENLAPILKKHAFEQRVAMEIIRMKNEYDTVTETIATEPPALQQEEPQTSEQNVKTETAPLSIEKHIGALSIKQLLSMDGKELVRGAYLRILHRFPDPEGEKLYLDMLKQGLSPIGLISALRFSDEGKQVSEPIRHKAILYTLGALMRTRRFPGKIARYLYSLCFINNTRNLSRVLMMELKEHEASLREQGSKIQEQETRLLKQSSKLQEQEMRLIEQSSKIQEQETRLIDQNLRLQEKETRLLEQNSILQEQETRMINHDSYIHEQETRLLEQSAKLQEQETYLIEQYSNIQELRMRLLEQNSKIQEQGMRLLEQNSKLQEQDLRLLDQVSKIQEQETRLIDQNLKLQEQETCLLEQSSKLQEQETRLIGQSSKLQEQETRLIEQNSKLQEQETCLLEQSSKLQEQETRLIEQNSKLQDQEKRLFDQSSKLQEQEISFANRIHTLEAAIKSPSLPFSSYSESEPYLKRAEKRVGVKAPVKYSERIEKFYTYFSEIWGDGYEEVQQKHYESYLPHLPRNSKHQFLDIGCGAGEFLGFLQWHGIKTLGIDIKESEVTRCVDRGLIVQQADAINFLKEYNGFFCGISLLQVIEHIPQEQHIELFSLAKEKLSGDGVLIVETINPAHPLAFSGFFTDPTHLRPISIDYLAFIAQWCGFMSIGTLNLFPAPILPCSITDPKLHYYNHAIVARKGRKP